MESPHCGISMERNEEIVSSSSRWKPTEIQKKILEQLYEAGEHNPSRHRVNDITKLLKVHGDVEAKNVFYWFQNSHSRKKRSQQKSLMQELSVNPKANVGSSQPSIGSTPTSDSSASPMVLEFEPSVGLTPFSFQELLYSEESPSSLGEENIPPMNLLYSEESPSSFGGENIPPMNLFVRKHLQWTENGTVCHVDRASKKQKQENNSNQEYSINQKDITGSSKNPSRSYATNASSMAPALATTPVSSQRCTNSPSHKKSKTVLQFNLSVQLDLRAGAKQPLCEAVCDMNFKNDSQNMVRRDGWLGHFTKCALRPSECDIMTGSEIQEAENKGQLLELFPLHPDKNIRSERSPDFSEGNRTDPRGSNVVIVSEGEEIKIKANCWSYSPYFRTVTWVRDRAGDQDKKNFRAEMYSEAMFIGCPIYSQPILVFMPVQVNPNSGCYACDS